jgi:hypothetical protein
MPSWFTGVISSYPLGSFPQSGLPAVIVTHGGDYSLSQWHTKLGRYALFRVMANYCIWKMLAGSIAEYFPPRSSM